jgi:hypothetical protein
MEDLRRYLEEYVEPTIGDFERDPSSVRLAFIACVVAFHSVDYLAHPHKPATLRQQWNRKSKAFATVDDIAHAFKHVKAGNRASPDLRAQEVVSTAGAFDIATFARFCESKSHASDSHRSGEAAIFRGALQSST